MLSFLVPQLNLQFSLRFTLFIEGGRLRRAVGSTAKGRTYLKPNSNSMQKPIGNLLLNRRCSGVLGVCAIKSHIWVSIWFFIQSTLLLSLLNRCCLLALILLSFLLILSFLSHFQKNCWVLALNNQSFFLELLASVLCVGSQRA